MEDALGKSPDNLTDDMSVDKEGQKDDLQKRQAAKKEELRWDGPRTVKRRKDGKKLSSESDKSTKFKGPSSPAVGGKVVQVTTVHPANKNTWLVPLQTDMKGAPGVFTHIFDAYVLVTSKQLAVKYGIGMMDYQETEKSDTINWIALFDRVDVDRIAALFGVKQKVLWSPGRDTRQWVNDAKN